MNPAIPMRSPRTHSCSTATPNAHRRRMISSVEPANLKLSESGELAERARRAWQHRGNCDLCAHYCHIDRLETIKSAVRVAILFLGLTAAWGINCMERDQDIDLPEPSVAGDISLEAAIGERRSVRDFSKRSLSLADVAQLLWAAQGVTSRDGGRTAPSAGALYPLEIYLVAGDVDSLPAGLYRYLPRGHRLQLISEGDLRKPLARAALDQSWVRRAPAVLIVAGVYERSAKKYGERARRYTRIETGHAAQNVYLQATALGLGTVIVGAFEDTEVQGVLGLPADHAPLALMPVGHPR
jgi:SagB-type dehydrogenase family enzyme